MKNLCFLKYKAISLTILLYIIFSGCSYKALKFKDADPVMYCNDIHPIPVPKSVHRDWLNYYANIQPPKPTVKTLSISGNQEARDINSIDQVPASSWFIPRLGFETISEKEIVAGATELGPPKSPITIIKIRKKKDNPRLFIRDVRNIYYLLKFDPFDYPCISTTTSFIVNRLFWSFGYHVPESHLFYLNKDEIQILQELNISKEDINKIFNKFASPVNDKYRSIAIRIIEGLPLGPAPEKGVRNDDPNDLFPHHERRVLRGLKVFCSFTNMCDISSGNIFDIYVGEENKGYIKHYLIDFDDSFGTHAARNQQLWAGFNHVFSIPQILKNFITFGLTIDEWERLKETQWKSVGTFEASAFNPVEWKETHSFAPIRYSQPSDDYWAAKILSELKEHHIKALIKAADYPEPAAADYIIQTLIERRAKIINHFYRDLSPLEFIKNTNNSFTFQDVSKLSLMPKPTNTKYSVQLFNEKNKRINTRTIQYNDSSYIKVEIKNDLLSSSYITFKISSNFENQPVNSPAQFHFRKHSNGLFKHVGTIH